MNQYHQHQMLKYTNISVFSTPQYLRDFASRNYVYRIRLLLTPQLMGLFIIHNLFIIQLLT
jgi:hypothetical protein